MTTAKATRAAKPIHPKRLKLESLFKLRLQKDNTVTFDDVCREFKLTAKEVLNFAPAVADAPVADAPVADVPEVAPVETPVVAGEEDELAGLLSDLLEDDPVVRKTESSVLVVDETAPLEDKVSAVDAHNAPDEVISIHWDASNSEIPKPDSDDSDIPIFDEPEEAVSAPSVEKSVDFMSMLDSLSDLNVDEDDAMSKTSLLKAQPSQLATTKVVCLASSYEAGISGLPLIDKSAIRNSTGTLFDTNDTIYRTIYKHIEQSTPPKPPYDKWIKLTALPDLETLFYGLYSATYRNDNEYTIKCQHKGCTHENKVSVPASALLNVSDTDTFERVRDVLANVKSFADLKGRSIVGNKEKLALTDSKMIVETRIPSLHDHLNIVKQFTKEAMDNMPEVFQYLLFTKSVYLLDEKGSMRTGAPKFFRYTNRSEVVEALATRIVSDDDETILKNHLEKALELYSVQYKLPTFNCAGCTKEIGPISMDLRSMLFMKLGS